MSPELRDTRFCIFESVLSGKFLCRYITKVDADYPAQTSISTSDII